MILSQALASKFGMGISLVKDDATADQIDLGPLRQLEGRWIGKPFMGWNVIAVPDKKFFTLEVIPYEEELTFTPVVVAINRGPIVDGVQTVQHITGLIYEQVITSVCTTDFCKQRGLASTTPDGKPNTIHAETGLFLNLIDETGGFSVARLATVPHGNSVLALGNAFTFVPDNNSFFDPAPIVPSVVTKGDQFPGFGYTEGPYILQQFPDQFDQTNPNSFLEKTLGTDKITSMTTIKMDTRDGTGGILNIPFINTNINTNFMTATFWIQEIEGASALQLQYTQTINLIFPAGGTTKPLINWPHVTVSTLQKVSDDLNVEKAFQ